LLAVLLKSKDGLLDEERDGVLWADSAYRSKEISAELKVKRIKNMIHEKGYRGNPLTEEQKIETQRKAESVLGLSMYSNL
jgi:transposase, IS5 family